jgi:hypothetical protein
MKRFLESIFSRYLRNLVQKSKVPIRLEYHSGIGSDTVFENCGFPLEMNRESLSINILSTMFFSRFPQYPTAFEVLTKEGLASEERKRTVHISDLALLARMCATETEMKSTIPQNGTLNKLRWELVRLLRSISKNDSSSDASWVQSSSLFDPIDVFVASSSSNQSIYRRKASEGLLASQLFHGNNTVVTVLDLIIRAGLISSSVNEASKALSMSLSLLPFVVHVWAFAKG